MQHIKKYFSDLLESVVREHEAGKSSFERETSSLNIASKVKKGMAWYPVMVTGTTIGLGGDPQIKLTRQDTSGDHRIFKIGKPARVVCLYAGDNTREEPIIGMVESISAKDIVLSIESDDKDPLPDWLTYGVIGVEKCFDEISAKRGQNALITLRDLPQRNNESLIAVRDTLLGFQTQALNVHEKTYAFQGLNNSQSLAVQKALEAPHVAIIHGPPGTGKTRTLVEAIFVMLQFDSGAKILATAPSNTAVDLLTKRLSDRGVPEVVRLGNPNKIGGEIEPYSLEYRISKHPDYNFLLELREEIFLYRRLKRMEDAAKSKKHAKKLEQRIISDIILNARVITSTLVGSKLPVLGKTTFDVVFIDEAAQALEPDCWVPILKGRKVVLSGDHFQLPPVIKNKAGGGADLSITLFEKAIEKNPQAVTMLKDQYRMHEAIMGFPNKMFYEELRADSTVKSHTVIPQMDFGQIIPLRFMDVNKPIEFIDTAGYGYHEKTVEDSESLVNEREARFLVKHLVSFKKKIHAHNPRLLEQLTIGINSPYKAQVKHLAESIKKNPHLKSLQYLDVNTVDAFQGQERDVIYISLVRSNAEKKLGFLEETRRMNVAITRAKKKLVMIGDGDTLSTNSFYQELIKYIKAKKGYRTIEEAEERISAYTPV